MTRGISLNNPGNIRISAATWMGKITPSRDSEFETFDTIEHGIRAIAKIISNYQKIYELRTIRQLISRWAPPSDNNPTDAYINNVSDRSGFDPDATLNMNDAGDLEGIITGIIDQENGGMHDITADQIAAGIAAALA